MNKATSPKLAVAAVFPATMVPIILPVLLHAAVPDFMMGVVVGVLLGASVLLIALALNPRPA